jgi:hypothetical protein
MSAQLPGWIKCLAAPRRLGSLALLLVDGHLYLSRSGRADLPVTASVITLRNGIE